MKRISALAVLLCVFSVVLCVGLMNVSRLFSGGMMHHAVAQQEAFAVSAPMPSSGFCGMCVAMIDHAKLEKMVFSMSLVLLVFVAFFQILALVDIFRDRVLWSGIDPPRRFDPLRSFLYQHRHVVLLM